MDEVFKGTQKSSKSKKDQKEIEKLQSHVQLSLLHQLTAGLKDFNEIRIKWLNECVMNLNLSDQDNLQKLHKYKLIKNLMSTLEGLNNKKCEDAGLAMSLRTLNYVVVGIDATVNRFMENQSNLSSQSNQNGRDSVRDRERERSERLQEKEQDQNNETLSSIGLDRNNSNLSLNNTHHTNSLTGTPNRYEVANDDKYYFKNHNSVYLPNDSGSEKSTRLKNGKKSSSKKSSKGGKGGGF